MRKKEIVDLPNGNKYLILTDCDNTLAAMVMLNEVPIEWLDWYDAPLGQVTNPQTIYGASPHRFGIKIN